MSSFSYSTMRNLLPQLILTLVFFSAVPVGASARDRQLTAVSPERYLDVMQTAVEAYSTERIEEYIARVDSAGITEHGFPRLTANIGILIAHGRLSQDAGLFERMMDICAREIPVARTKNAGKGEIGNDFAVKEICCCLMELEASGAFPKSRIDEWKAALSQMKAEDIYSVRPKIGENRAHNVCVYGAASECARVMAGIGGDRAYADRYLQDQLRFFDENGMYMDPHQPITYDLVTRLQFMAALDFGYDGPALEGIEAALEKSALPTLEMQSATGEIPYGGRSNEFLHNDTFYAAVCEFYASWYSRKGDAHMAARFKAAAAKAIESLDYWTQQQPVRHVKNRYPTETKYGCEDYAHFDKYMVTTASWAYLAYRFSTKSSQRLCTRREPSTFVTSPAFHRIIMNAGGYSVQFDLDAQKEYDASGIGRFQKRGASPVVALSSPAPAGKPKYHLDIKNPDGGLAIGPMWSKYILVESCPGKVVLTDSTSLWTCRLSRRGLRMTLQSSTSLTISLPAFEYDGESHSEIQCTGKTMTVSFKGSQCRYHTNGTITDTGLTYASRNGHLRRFDAIAQRKLVVTARIFYEDSDSYRKKRPCRKEHKAV